ncbi:Hypothetical predicted protein [Mytilus galloprovincialis]|uniref:Mab-21-like HhH/H2TH-like domain-containing protein n=1 Tax=Mytilus galloprovincialis TaxID=29158 RepID=A0A8B6G2J4_MYTGA|nr:Hypothetical predicted protein [Mytilus galloprovincialis]
MNAVRDNILSNKEHTNITGGSFGEGLDMRGSDLDVMAVSRTIEVYENIKPFFNPNITYFSMDIDDVKPGYAQLKQDNSKFRGGVLKHYCEEQHGKHYFSSTLYKQGIANNMFPSTIHGPCISNPTGHLDLASSLHCNTWVSPAIQWITRSNNSWPKHNVKRAIIKHGVLFVPIGVKGSPKEDLEWRISFSVGEKFLINTFTHTQLLCYALLKIILKDVIATFSGCEDLLCSYFLKTIVFWVSEELPQSVWEAEYIIPCFMRCFSRLIYCVEHSVCLHYFIPENNMFENKIVGRAREVLLEKLYMLNSYNWRCILFSDQMSNFNLSIWNIPIEPHAPYSKEIQIILSSYLWYLANLSLGFKISSIVSIRIKQMYMCQQSSKSSLKDVYIFCMSKYCHVDAQRVQLISTLGKNKYQYKQYKSCLSTLIDNIYHDAVSGWLMVATLFYKTNQYRKALNIVRYSLSKCTPEKLCFMMTLSDIHCQLLKLQTFQKKSIMYLLKTLIVDEILFCENSTLLPDELRLNQWNKGRTFQSTAYAYFVNFLCYYHLSDVRQCQDSLQSLQLVISERYFVKSTHPAAGAYNLLGVALLLLSDNESARHAFLQSVKLYPSEFHNSAVKRLLLLS